MAVLAASTIVVVVLALAAGRAISAVFAAFAFQATGLPARALLAAKRVFGVIYPFFGESDRP
ncbi:MAG: hypothetical protein NVS2B15_12800 [Pseudarthrobacter sp.]